MNHTSRGPIRWAGIHPGGTRASIAFLLLVLFFLQTLIDFFFLTRLLTPHFATCILPHMEDKKIISPLKYAY